MRDSQKEKVYRSERQVGHGHSQGVQLTYAEAQDFVRRVEVRAYVRRLDTRTFGSPMKVIPGAAHRRRGVAHRDTSIIKVPEGCRSQGYLLHEMAHVLAPEGSGHGWMWAALYLNLVRNVLGREQHDKLKRAFKANRVRFTEPRPRRQVSEEERAVLAERLKAARAAKALKVAA